MTWKRLEKQGFGLVLDRDAQLIAQTKAAIVKEVHHGEGKRIELAKLVQAATNKEISSVSKLFSAVEGLTLDHYYLLQRLERVKERWSARLEQTDLGIDATDLQVRLQGLDP